MIYSKVHYAILLTLLEGVKVFAQFFSAFLLKILAPICLNQTHTLIMKQSFTPAGADYVLRTVLCALMLSIACLTNSIAS